MPKLFRDISIERLSSPERLDELIQVTDPKGWIALVAIAILIGIAIAWGFLGKIPTTVNGNCMLLKTGGVVNIATTNDGRLTELVVKVGELLEKDSLIAKFELFSLNKEITKAKEQLHLLIDQQSHQQHYQQARKQHLQQRKALLNQRLAARQGPKNAVTEQQLEDVQSELDSLALEKLLAAQLVKAKRSHLQILEEKYSAQSQLRTPFAGRVIEIKANVGDVINAGVDIIGLERLSEQEDGLHAVIYVSALDGKIIQPQMAATISPSIIKREEYGAMLATVTQVSRFPTSSRAMMRTLQNKGLVKQIMQQGPQIQVLASLIPTPDAISGYAWTSLHGPPVQIQSGTLCDASVTVKTQRPVTLVIPFVKHISGM